MRFEYSFHFDEGVQSNRKTLQDMRESMLAANHNVSISLKGSPPSTFPQQDLHDIAAAFNEFSYRITIVHLTCLSSKILEQLVPALTHLEVLVVYEETATPVTQHILPTLAAHDSLKTLAVRMGTCNELAMMAIIEELPRFVALEQLDLHCMRPWTPKVFAIFADFVEAQGLQPPLTHLHLGFMLVAKREADETLPLVTRLVRKINSTPVSLHLMLGCGASICSSAVGSLFRNFMSAVQAADNIELHILHHGGNDDFGKELKLAAQQYRGIRRLDLKIPKLQAERLEFLFKAKVERLSFFGAGVVSTKEKDEMVQAMLQNGTIQEVKVGGTVLPCEHIFKRNKLLATVVNKPPPAASVMPLALHRLLQTDLGATPAYALLRCQVPTLLLEHQLPQAAF